MSSLNKKEIGRKFAESRKNLIKSALITSTAAFLTLSAASCKNDAKRYENGVPQQEIKVKNAELQTLIDAYNDYFDMRNERQKKLAELQAAGDVGGCENVFNQIKEIEDAIKRTEKKIDKTGTKILDLTQEIHKGRKESLSNQAAQKAKYQYGNAGLKRRTFKEYTD